MAAGRRSVIWAESARAALDDVIAYIAQDSGDAAVRVLTRALDAAGSLDHLAERGRVVPEMNQPNLRELFVFDYRLLYRVFEEGVVIVAFVHGARDFASWRLEQRRMKDADPI
jgi:toxin ParE1/3/4